MVIRGTLAGWLGVQQRADAPDTSYTALMRRLLVAETDQAATTAAVQFGVGLLARAFAVADVSPDVPALTPEYRASMIHDIILRGEHVAVVQVARGRPMLYRAQSHDIQGGYDPRTWRYHVELPGPTSSSRMGALYEQVAHVRYLPRAAQPWRGVSPLAEAGLSTELLGKIEGSLNREFDSLTLSLISHPSGYLPNADRRREFAGELSSAQRQVLVEAGNEGWRQRGPAGSWEQVRLGPDPTSAEMTLREQVAQDVLSAIGVPAGLYAPREGAVSRESYRQLLSAAILPYAELCLSELRRALSMPGLRIGFHRLAAADVAARARAYGSLVQAGVTPESAARIAGIEDAEMQTVAPEPSSV